MWHKPCRTFHPWCPCIKTRCLYSYWNDALGLIPEMIHSRLALIWSFDPDWPIAFHKCWLTSAHQIEKIWNQTVSCQLNHYKNHSLGNLELKLCIHYWMKNVRHDIYLWRHNGIYKCRYVSFMASSVHAHSVAHDKTCFGHAIFDRYVYMINLIENIQTVDTRQTMLQ